MAFFKKRLGLTRLSCKCLVLALIIEIYGLYCSVCVRSLKRVSLRPFVDVLYPLLGTFHFLKPSVCSCKKAPHVELLFAWA